MGSGDISPRGGSRGWPYPQRSAIEQLGDMDRDDALAFMRRTGDLLMVHKFGVDELMTKLRIWSEEFDYAHEHDPIEHITSRSRGRCRTRRSDVFAARTQRGGARLERD
ncbi:hypothetical protein [Saccharopolyspora sp. ASAGF58]|uniref:hypothetical protein n=1 Tax=Saccharopolyspora sp. ASAGF58 TaxID=2719023 RepID=UPI001FF09041|nr:hypothetical protein [Saccharopolyspora sp. ASAGF58]